MNNVIESLREQMAFVSIDSLQKAKRIGIHDPKYLEKWDENFSDNITLEKDFPNLVKYNSYCLILELLKQGAENGYILISIPVLIDIADESDRKNIRLTPDVTVSVILNSAYYMQERQCHSPKLKLNDEYFSHDQLLRVFDAGSPRTFFEKTKLFLYQSTNVKTLGELINKVQKQLRSQAIRPKFSLVERVSDPSKFHLLSLYEGLIRDGSYYYRESCLPKLASIYDSVEHKVECTSKEVYCDFLELSRDNYDPSKPYLLGHMDVQKANINHKSATISSSRELFPLDNTQRHASLAAAYLDENYKKDNKFGRVLAINGPPGSGKTSMLKAVVAHYFVKAALLQESCPIIVASGATNQSVKNVTSAFPDVVQSEHEDNLLYCQRWIPHCPTYGSFYASDGAVEKLTDDEKSNIPILKISGENKFYNFEWEGVGDKLNDLYDNKDLAKYYIGKAKIYFSQLSRSIPNDVEDVVSELHQMLLETYKDMANAIYEAREQLLSPGGDITKVFPIDCEDEHLITFILARNELIQLYEEDTLSIYKKVCREIIRDQNITPDQYSIELRETAILLLIEQCVDTEYRTRLFHLAARYWEGKYILDQVNNLHISRTKENIIEGLRRVCMITPVIISTISRLPSLLKISSYMPGSVQIDYAYGGIDLLITDESGQATITGGFPLSGLTKRLISVGDVKQLAPILGEKSVTNFDEFFAWLKYGYSQEQIVNFFEDKLSVTEGSFLHLVQRASSLNYQGNGFMLRGHYRCYENIIDYCNKMVYDNKLFYIPPLKKDLRSKGLPAMAYIESFESSSVGNNGKSKQNINEAKMIAQMIVNRYTEWQNILGDNNKPYLQDMIAIVTPFKKQPEAIKEALIKENILQESPITEHEIDSVIINTVHALQGAEKDIIIYSGVQSKDDSSILYFQEEPFLLNVAISRAKKSFIAFLSPELYRLNDSEFLAQSKPDTANSIHYLGWYMAKFGERLFPDYLFVVEAPGKKDSLEQILKEKYLVLTTSGAVTELGLEDSSVETAKKQIRPHYKLNSNGREVIKKIISEGPKVEKIYLATDDDNVGETIAWHLYHNILKEAPDLIKKVERVPLREITLAGVREAMSNVREINNDKVSAEVVRDIVDKWLGQYMSDLLRTRLRSDHPGTEGMGRVKATILDVLARHEKTIQRRRENTLDVQLTVNGRDIKGVIYDVSERVMKSVEKKLTEEATKVMDANSKNYEVISADIETVSYLPFNRSTFEIMALAWKMHDITPDVTMRLLQRLYEGNL